MEQLVFLICIWLAVRYCLIRAGRVCRGVVLVFFKEAVWVVVHLFPSTFHVEIEGCPSKLLQQVHKAMGMAYRLAIRIGECKQERIQVRICSKCLK
jgi:hypothetical protein